MVLRIPFRYRKVGIPSTEAICESGLVLAAYSARWFQPVWLQTAGNNGWTELEWNVYQVVKTSRNQYTVQELVNPNTDKSTIYDEVLHAGDTHLNFWPAPAGNEC